MSKIQGYWVVLSSWSFERFGVYLQKGLNYDSMAKNTDYER